MYMGKIDRSDADEWQEYYGFVTAVNNFKGGAFNDWWNEHPADAFLQAAIEGGVAAEGLPSQFTGLLMRDAQVDVSDNSSHQFEKVVALKMADGQEALLGCTYDRANIRRYEDSTQRIEIAWASPGRAVVTVFRLEKELDGHAKIYSADRELAKALSVSQETAREWLSTLCSISKSIWDEERAHIREASALGDGAKVSSYLQDLLSIATAMRTGSTHLLSPDTVASFNDLCRLAPGRFAQIESKHIESSWAWKCLQRLVHDRRARRQITQLPELFNALCVEHADLLASEPAPLNPNMRLMAWVEDNVRFTLFDDAEAKPVEYGCRGQCLRVEGEVGPGPAPASFLLEADSILSWHDESDDITCALSFGGCFGLDYTWAEDYGTGGRFWKELMLSPAMFSASGADSAESAAANVTEFQDLWKRGDPHGDWGGPARFTLLMVALSLSFADRFFKAGEPAANGCKVRGRAAKPEIPVNDVDEHSSESWTSDEEVDGEQEALAFSDEDNESESDEDNESGDSKLNATVQRLPGGETAKKQESEHEGGKDHKLQLNSNVDNREAPDATRRTTVIVVVDVI
ncbi:hypothetical protein HDU87_003051 [Geranomyces variabilis]|uniref:Uncharacterized protein n=1 Tax=Geranomyces variabilis TaxID=109894 RepID=A0AAD5TKX3_9FUNG|nr:hypothetical protein HDU87_003051 [Geranomyces variabilis]